MESTMALSMSVCAAYAVIALTLMGCEPEPVAPGEDAAVASGADAGTTPRRDAGSTRVDGGDPAEDAGVASVDTHVPSVDAALPPGESYRGLAALSDSTTVTSFPVVVTFDDDRYDRELHLPWTAAGATHRHEPTAGWNGRGAARFTPPSTGEGMSGLGQFHGLRNAAESSFLSIRYCLSAGPTFPSLGHGAKPIILWRSGAPAPAEDHSFGARPMVISRPTSAGIAYGLCDGTVCTYYGGDYWPEDGLDTWVVTADGAWSCLEFEFDLANDRMALYVTTRDGRFDDTEYFTAAFRDEPSGPGGVHSLIDTIGGYFAQAPSDPGNYYLIDDLVIDIRHIGPPAGFVE